MVSLFGGPEKKIYIYIYIYIYGPDYLREDFCEDFPSTSR